MPAACLTWRTAWCRRGCLWRANRRRMRRASYCRSCGVLHQCKRGCDKLIKTSKSDACCLRTSLGQRAFFFCWFLWANAYAAEIHGREARRAEIFLARVMFAFRNKVTLGIFSQFTEKMQKQERSVWIKYMKNSRNNFTCAKNCHKKLMKQKFCVFWNNGRISGIYLVNVHIYLENSRGTGDISRYVLLTTNQKFSIIVLSNFEVEIVSKIQVIQSKIQEKLVRTDKIWFVLERA